jgi:alanyl-tRNA synthetase
MKNDKKKTSDAPGGAELTERMRKFSGASIVESFLEYYGRRGHRICDSAPLLPDDPTLLFTAAGMVPFKAYYADPDAAPFSTAASCQKCLRAGGKQSDLENVGRTLRHHTFFEMLGNFSFGDYFKKEAIDTAWDLSVNVWGLDRERIWVSVYEDDDEAHELWARRIGVPRERIVRLGKKDNFWGPVGETGICGPCSELYYDTGEGRSCDRPGCKPGCDCDRYIEYWNLVFPQFFLNDAGVYDPLPRPGIDTGLGLERVAFILQGVEDNFHTDLFLPVRSAVLQALPGGEQGSRTAVAVNVAADHVRALVFAMSEGIMPSNEGRGYVLRRLLRRALTKMHMLGVEKPFLAGAVDAVTGTMGPRYPELVDRGPVVKEIVTAEEERFLSTIEQGLGKFRDVVKKTRRAKERRIAGRDGFVLYDTYGFPIELTKELALEEGLEVDVEGFEAAMAEQKARARGASFHVHRRSEGEADFTEIEPVERTEFLGYEALSCDARAGLARVFVEDERVIVDLATDRTVFYAESGGQVGDTGTVRIGGRTFVVSDTFRREDLIVHRIEWGPSSGGGSGDDVEAFLRAHPACHLAVDAERRLATARNHTTTHLLHAALRSVLGAHVAQAGSLVSPERFRFDFHHHQVMSEAEIRAVEEKVNEAVLADLPVVKEVLPYKKAVADGAIALFGEKYTNDVRVVTVEGVSKELCGGTHLDRTGQIGAFLVRQETAVGAGLRRIEGLTGRGAFDHVRRAFDERLQAARLLKAAPEEVEGRIRALLEENERLKRKLVEQESRMAGGQVGDVLQTAEEAGGVRLVTMTLAEGDAASLRRWGDRVREKLEVGVGLLCLAASEGKPMLLIVASDRAVSEKRIKANELAAKIGEALSLRGGGKPHMAQMGLEKKEDFDRVKSLVRSILERQG